MEIMNKNSIYILEVLLVLILVASCRINLSGSYGYYSEGIAFRLILNADSTYQYEFEKGLKKIYSNGHWHFKKEGKEILVFLQSEVQDFSTINIIGTDSLNTLIGKGRFVKVLDQNNNRLITPEVIVNDTLMCFCDFDGKLMCPYDLTTIEIEFIKVKYNGFESVDYRLSDYYSNVITLKMDLPATTSEMYEIINDEMLKKNNKIMFKGIPLKKKR